EPLQPPHQALGGLRLAAGQDRDLAAPHLLPARRLEPAQGGAAREADAEREGSGDAGVAAHPMRALCPPSTARATAVMQRASSEAMNTAAQATSHAVPTLAPGVTVAWGCSISFCFGMPSACERPSIAIGVSIRPGMITLARTPNFALPSASD